MIHPLRSAGKTLAGHGCGSCNLIKVPSFPCGKPFHMIVVTTTRAAILLPIYLSPKSQSSKFSAPEAQAR